MDKNIIIFWFRRDLRLEDNAGLYYALKSGFEVLPVFIFDTNILSRLEDKQDARVQFIHEQISALHHKLSEAGGTLKVEIGDPAHIFQELIKKYPLKGIYTNRDYEPYARQRDASIEKLCEDNDLEFLTFKDHVIFEEGEILTDAQQPYKVFTPFKNKWLAQFEQLKLTPFNSENLLSGLWKNEKYTVPFLDQVGFEKSSITIPERQFDFSLIRDYEAKRNFPAIHGTSRLGIHLRHGTVSIREAVKIGAKNSATWLNELIWREFYMMILAYFPHVVDRAFKPKYDQIPWRNNEQEFQKWCEGQTGYPIVDAGMRELVQTGFMHNRVRMIVASFLTKHLLIDWRWGEAFFARHLLDYELASNNGGWQWAAGTGTDAQPYFRVFNPASQTEKFDKQMKYIKKWVPEYDTDKYPRPIVDHKLARNRAIDTYKEALS